MMTSFEIVQLIVKFRLLFREAAGRLNTAQRRPAGFPLRVLYGCMPPGYKTSLPFTLGQYKNYGRKKTACLSGAVSALRRCVQHLPRTLT
ncbi:hypothetical protein [Nitrosomonas sp. Nm34]|uniref:hypothetical protein n=1 Tax=Nitrosomonas sp. Nm34 TaxID=1881055 RepID=UPI0011135941|nr:hypothetical protein [Nitrosomonas sp. Nm34]